MRCPRSYIRYERGIAFLIYVLENTALVSFAADRRKGIVFCF